MSDPYAILGVSKDASADEIKKAYHKKAREFHPDVSKEVDAEVKFRECASAYEILSDSQKRRHYDETHNGNGFSFDSIFNPPRWAGGIAPQRGSDIRLHYSIDLIDTYLGNKKPIEFNRTEICEPCAGTGLKAGRSKSRCKPCRGTGNIEQTFRQGNTQVRNISMCGTCRGRGTWIDTPDRCEGCKGHGQKSIRHTFELNIQRGITEDVEIVARGEGNAGKHGGPRGDVYVRCIIQPHPRFTRHGIDLVANLPISYVQACLGATIPVELVDGTVKDIELKPLYKEDAIIVENLGLNDLRSPARGKLILNVKITTPDVLTDEQKTLLKQLGDLESSYDAQNN